MLGIGSAIKSGFNILMGGSSAPEKILDSTISGLDKIYYSKEEQADDRKEAAKNWLEVQKTVATQSTPTSVSRRIVAWGVLGLVWFEVVVCTVLAILEMVEELKLVLEIAAVFQIGWAFCTVIVFYFGPHLISSMGKPKS